MKTRWTSGIAGQWLFGLEWFSLYRDRHTVPLGLLNRIIICTLSHTTPVHSCLKTHADTDSFICLKLHTHTPTLQLTHLSEASHTQTKFICVNLHTHLYSLTCLQLHKHLSSLICLKFQDSSVVRVLDLWSKGRGFKSLQEWRENFLLWGQISVLTLILVSVPPPCYRSSTKKTLVSLPKVEVAGYS